MVRKISSFTDESGQDTRGKFFAVCTCIINSQNTEEIESVLLAVEKDSGKMQKWYHSGNSCRYRWSEEIIRKQALKKIHIYCSIFHNKTDYTKLVGAGIAKAVITNVKEKPYIAKIFIDRPDKKVLEGIKREVKSYRVRYKKIKGLSETNSSMIRLSDAICGMLRDINHKNTPTAYKDIFNKIKFI